MIYIVVAYDLNRIIGSNNSLPWNFKKDMKHFKKTTLNKTIAMGRKTFESIGKPLPKRKNLIISSKQHSIEDIITMSFKEDIYIIGGEMIYKEFLPFADIIYATEIQNEYKGDTAFPELSSDLWKEVDCREDTENNTTLLFKTYKSIARAFTQEDINQMKPLFSEHTPFILDHLCPKIRKKLNF